MRRTKKVKNFFKTYFYFSQGERKGVLVLCVLLVVVMFLPMLFSAFKSVPEIQFSDLPSTIVAQTSEPSDEVAPTLFPFNPNTATPEQLIALGFTPKQAKTIVHYRQKGGKFRMASDLSKLYGVSPKLIQQLEPYVRIPAEQILDTTKTSFSKTIQAPVELNSADSMRLVQLYRIGPALTHRILEYRNKLGGFVSLKQLTEIYGFDEDILYDLEGKVVVDASRAKIYNLNTVTVDELKTHPYFKYKLSNAIVNYRSQHGDFQNLSDLRKIVLVNDSIYRNITQYLKL